MGEAVAAREFFPHHSRPEMQRSVSFTRNGRLIQRRAPPRTAAHVAPPRRYPDFSERILRSSAAATILQDMPIAELTRLAEIRGSAQGTKLAQRSHWQYWQSFCAEFGIDADRFGDQRPPSDARLAEEIRILAQFATFVVFRSRVARRLQGRLPWNSVTYATQVLASIRTAYALRHGRRPGITEGAQDNSHLVRVLKGLKTLAPLPKARRLPLLHQHLSAIRQVLDLRTNELHRVLWALWLTKWQAVLRSSHLIRHRADSARPWDPARDTHRQRVSVSGMRISPLPVPVLSSTVFCSSTLPPFALPPSPT